MTSILPLVISNGNSHLQRGSKRGHHFTKETIRMKKLHCVPAVIAIIILSAASLFAADIGVTGIGARATSLGGSYRALSDDWSGMYWNPAGITQIKGWHAGLATELIVPVGSYAPAPWNDSSFSITRQTKTQSEPQFFVAPAFGVVRKVSDRLTVGLGAWVPLGMGGKWDLLDIAGYNSAFPQFDYEIDLKTFDLHPTAAFKLSDMFSFGAGIGLVYTNLKILQPLFFPNPYTGVVEYGGVNVSKMPGSKFYDSLTTLGGLRSDYNHLVAVSEFAASGIAYSANFGGMATLTDQLQIGVSGHYYGNVKLSGTMNATMYYPDNPSVQTLLDNSWGDTTFHYKALESYYKNGRIKKYERDAALDAYSGDTSLVFTGAKATLTLPLPADVGIGIAYKAINQNDRHLIISSDFQYTFSSVWKSFDIDISGNGISDTFQFVQNWNNSFRVGVGVEFKINPVWTLRSACYVEKNSGIPETLTPIFPDINPRSSVNVGFQFNIKPDIALHCSYEGIFFKERHVPDWVFNYNNMFYDNMAGTYNFHVNNLMLGLDVSF